MFSRVNEFPRGSQRVAGIQGANSQDVVAVHFCKVVISASGDARGKVLEGKECLEWDCMISQIRLLVYPQAPK